MTANMYHISNGILYFNNGETIRIGRFTDASSYVCKSLGLRGFEFQLYFEIFVTNDFLVYSGGQLL